MSKYRLEGVDFKWAKSKAESNRRKHGISFHQAAGAFFDPFLVVVEASRKGEPRQAVIGLTERWRLLHVVFIEQEDHIRIISARPATAQERKNYET